VGHELIEALSKFKLSNVPPLPPSSLHESSSSFKAIVVHSKEKQSSYYIDRGKLNPSLEN
jgi:hypothetical protein